MRQRVTVAITTISLLSFFLAIAGLAEETHPTLDRPPLETEENVHHPRRLAPGAILSPITILNLLCEDTELRKQAGITDDQIKALGTLINETARQRQAVLRKYGTEKLSKEEETKRREELLELQKDLMPGIAKILTAEQMRQFYLTHYLILGGMDSPLVDIEMIRFLKLDEAQTAKITEIMKKRLEEMSERFRQLQADSGGKQLTPEETDKIRAEGLEIARRYGGQIRETLTPEQRKMEEDAQKAAPVLQYKLRQFIRRRAAPKTP